MSILSITFHTTENRLQEWEMYLENDLHQMIENLIDVDKYILSEVDSKMINEGKNTNLFLMFANSDLREQFLINELQNIAEHINARFGQEVLIFDTRLNIRKLRF